MLEGGSQKLETFLNSRLIRLAVTLARAIGDLPGSLLETTKVIGKLEHAERARKRER